MELNLWHLTCSQVLKSELNLLEGWAMVHRRVLSVPSFELSQRPSEVLPCLPFLNQSGLQVPHPQFQCPHSFRQHQISSWAQFTYEIGCNVPHIFRQNQILGWTHFMYESGCNVPHIFGGHHLQAVHQCTPVRQFSPEGANQILHIGLVHLSGRLVLKGTQPLLQLLEYGPQLLGCLRLLVLKGTQSVIQLLDRRVLGQCQVLQTLLEGLQPLSNCLQGWRDLGDDCTLCQLVQGNLDGLPLVSKHLLQALVQLNLGLA